MVKVDVVKPSIRLGKGSEIFAVLRNNSEAIDNLTVYFYLCHPCFSDWLRIEAR